jgi:disulfide bond formation protein DsbB
VKHFRRWGAVYVLLALFIGSWLGQFFTQLSEVRSDQQMHEQPFVWADFLVQFFASTFENWQSEWLQLIFQAILLLGAKHWLFQVDAEDMERLEKKVDAISERLGLDPDVADEPGPEQEQSP